MEATKSNEKIEGVAKNKDGGSIDTATRCSESGKLIKFIPVPYDYSNSAHSYQTTSVTALVSCKTLAMLSRAGPPTRRKLDKKVRYLCMC